MFRYLLHAFKNPQRRRMRYFIRDLLLWRLKRVLHYRRIIRPWVSVVIPVRNGATTIVDTIRSLQAQSFNAWEAIVIDDGSSDNTPQLISDIARDDPRIRSVRQESLGVSSARNRGVMETIAPWVMFLDADDWIADIFMDRMFAALIANPNASIVYCGSNRVLSDGTPLAETPGMSMTYPDELQDDPVKHLSLSCPLAIHSVIVRRQAIVGAGLFDASLKTSEDWDLWLRVARVGAKFVGVPLPLAWYRLQKEPGDNNNLNIIIDAHKVLTLARQPDQRILNPDPRYATGFHDDDIVPASAGVTLYFAGVTAGAKVSPRAVLSVQSAWPDFRTPEKTADLVRDIEAGLAVGARCAHSKLAYQWNKLLPYIEEILECLEQANPEQQLRQHCFNALETRVIREADLHTPCALQTVHGFCVDLASNLPFIEPAVHLNKVYVRAMIDSCVVAELWLTSSFIVEPRMLARQLLDELGVSASAKTIIAQWRSAIRWLFRRKKNEHDWRQKLKVVTCIPSLLRQAQLPFQNQPMENKGQVGRVIDQWRQLIQEQTKSAGKYRKPQSKPITTDESPVVNRASSAIPVLMYHSVSDHGPAALAQWRLSPAKLEQQLQYLHQQGYYTVTSAECLRLLKHGGSISGRPILLTFDDGYCDFREHAWPVLQRFGFKAEVFLVTDRVGNCALWDVSHGAPAPLMDWDEISKLQDDGVVFGSHLATHRCATSLTMDELVEEAARSRFTLQQRLGIVANNIAIPFGVWDWRLISALEWVGYEIGYTTESGTVRRGAHPLLLPRIEITGDETLASFANKLAIDVI